MRTLPKIKLPADDYIKIIAGKPIETPASDLVVGSCYKLVNKTTRTYMERESDHGEYPRGAFRVVYVQLLAIGVTGIDATTKFV